jgi:hypothetical protein
MTEPWEWTEADLLALVTNQVTESLTLDYKECRALDAKSDKQKNDLSKDVSALANSAGGILVYGIVEKGHLPQSLDEGFDPAIVDREWIESVMRSRIQPTIDDVRIAQIALTSTHPGRCAYVVYVPQSRRAPHMASDHRYYKRQNFMSEPMEDYEVRDVGRRSTAPNLSIELRGPDPGITRDSRFAFYLWISNESETPAEYCIIDLGFDLKLMVPDPPGGSRPSGRVRSFVNDDYELNCFTMNYFGLSPPRVPIFKGPAVPATETNNPVVIAAPGWGPDTTYFIEWRIFAPGAAPAAGRYIISATNMVAKLERLDPGTSGG